MHWHLDVTFREDADSTLDKTAARNLNIIRKWYLNMLKYYIEIGNFLVRDDYAGFRVCIVIYVKPLGVETPGGFAFGG